MDLLPRSEKEFTDPLYWKRFFEQCETSFEWYGSYDKLALILEKYIRPTDAILQIGCGNSNLAEQLHDNGFRNVFSIDTDGQVIVLQKKKHLTKRPSLKFEQCSAASTGLPEGSVNVVVDKGTLDALLPPESSSSDLELVDSIFKEIDRCLAAFGRYVVITLAQAHIIRKLFDYFGNIRFMVRIQRCERTNVDFAMPVFAVIITKFKMALSERRPFEFVNSADSSAEPLPTIDKVMERICAAQQMNWFRHFISRGPVSETSVKICSLDDSDRYELIVVDDESLKTICKYGAFIVPFGREKDWLFATQKGRQILRKTCGLHRIVVVRLFRTQKYGSLEHIQKELNTFILDFMPKACAGQKINFLSLGSTDVTDHIESGYSEISGKWTVEQIRIKDSMFRRLIFMDSANLIQSEAEVKKSKNGQWLIDWSDLSCQHHKLMLISLEFLTTKAEQNAKGRKSIGISDAMDVEIRFALLGLGGGILAKFIHDKFPKSNITAIELDADIHRIALRHFDFPEKSDRLRIVICDALDFINEISGLEDDISKFDIMLVDLSGAVGEHGLYCPPPQFVTEDIIEQMKNCLRPNGVLSLNLVTRDELTTESVKKRLMKMFTSVYSVKGDEDVNEVIICPRADFPEPITPWLNETNGKKNKKLKKKSVGSEGNRSIEPWMAECTNYTRKLVKFV